ncbi:MAG: argininosuccinate lyase [Acidobacteriia bacterium]|nr:argininosuccinate lyase [Terriglobia bacterium]
MGNPKQSRRLTRRGPSLPRHLWGGRFQESAAPEFSRLNNSFPFDHRLLPFDIEGSVAYSKALQRAGVLNRKEAAAIRRALQSIELNCSNRPRLIRDALAKYEDVHSFVEAKLIEQVGEKGKKIHTGRSRNDQVALDLRLYLRHHCRHLCRKLVFLMETLTAHAQRDLMTILPGYTHLQRGQPVLLAHYWMAYFEMFSRDWERMKTTLGHINVMPLGSGALAGSGFPIDRRFLAKELGFQSITRNSLDAVSDRDFAAEFLFNGSLLMMHLSRLAEDLIIFSTTEFDFIELSDAVTSGSSLMPQKKNPDALELIRAKAARVYGNLVQMLVILKALPLSYNKDLQEDKECIFDTVETLDMVLEAIPLVLRTLKVKTQKMKQAAESGFLNATECADYLVRRGLPFRAAHETVGKVILYALQRGLPLEKLSLREFKLYSPLFGPDIFDAIHLKRCIESKSLQGGTATIHVKRAIEDARRYIARIQ